MSSLQRFLSARSLIFYQSHFSLDLHIRFEYKNHQDHKVIRKVVGREAQALVWLHEAGPKGITTREARHWAWSLSGYVHDLRHVHGLSIRTVNELHNGGWHGRYVLESSIEILPNKPTV